MPDGGAEAELERTLNSLKDLTIDQLRRLWRRLLLTEPPPLRAASLLRAELSWALQARMFGDLDAATRKRLATLARGGKARQKGEGQRSRLIVGMTLVREWRGREIRVEVIEGGFVLEGARFNSLSAIARHVAGVRWSGPRFFQLAEASAQKIARGRQ